MRQFTVDGPHLLLNGKRLMLRGYGDDHIYPEQMAMPADKQLHLKRLRTIKSYGFNHVRHHSTIMPPEYYDACDEVGMISTAEFPICYGVFLPGTGSKWKEQVPAGTDPARPSKPTSASGRRWSGSIETTPRSSAGSWGTSCGRSGCRGTSSGRTRRCETSSAASRVTMIPGGLFLDADGQDEKILDPKNDRGTLDFYVVGFDASEESR